MVCPPTAHRARGRASREPTCDHGWWRLQAGTGPLPSSQSGHWLNQGVPQVMVKGLGKCLQFSFIPRKANFFHCYDLLVNSNELPTSQGFFFSASFSSSPLPFFPTPSLHSSPLFPVFMITSFLSLKGCFSQLLAVEFSV